MLNAIKVSKTANALNKRMSSAISGLVEVYPPLLRLKPPMYCSYLLKLQIPKKYIGNCGVQWVCTVA